MGLALKKVCFLGVIFLISACAVKKEGIKNLSYKHESLRAYENAKDYDPTTKKATYKRNFFERHFKHHSDLQDSNTKQPLDNGMRDSSDPKGHHAPLSSGGQVVLPH